MKEISAYRDWSPEHGIQGWFQVRLVVAIVLVPVKLAVRNQVYGAMIIRLDMITAVPK